MHSDPPFPPRVRGQSVLRLLPEHVKHKNCRIEFAAAPGDVQEIVRRICMALPEVHEPDATYPPGARRWRVRNATFATLFSIDEGNGMVAVVEFIARGTEFAALVHVGPPFRHAPWGGDAVLAELSDTTDWDEIAEVLGDSYCLMAPKKLAGLVRVEGEPPTTQPFVSLPRDDGAGPRG